MKYKIVTLIISVSIISWSMVSSAGVLNPNCTVKKAVESAAMKATIGVRGRCTAAEAAKDSLGIKDKKKHRKHNGDGIVKKVEDKYKN